MGTTGREGATTADEGTAAPSWSGHELMRSFADCEVALLFSSGSRVARIDYTRALPTAPVMALTLRHAAELPFGPLHVHGFPW